MYEDYLEENKIADLLKKRILFEGKLRVNRFNRREAYVTVPANPATGESEFTHDVLILQKYQNRAFEGDVVIIKVFPESDWAPLKEAAEVAEVDPEEKEGTVESEDTEEEEEEAEGSGTEEEEGEEKEMKHHTAGKAEQQKEEKAVVMRPTGKVVFIKEKKHLTQKFIGKLEKPKNNNNKNDESKEQTHYKFVRFLPLQKQFPAFQVPSSEVPDVYWHNPAKLDKTVFEVKFGVWNTTSTTPLGHIVRQVGETGDISVDSECILIRYNVDLSPYPPDLTTQLEKPFELDHYEVLIRRDLRKDRIFTIDPTTARDLDDALSISVLPNGNYSVGVHIADVSYFVKTNTELDMIAQDRSTSVYMVHKVVPMLPSVLCENLCSLNPGVDRYSFSVLWELKESGEIVSTQFTKSLMRSCAKLSYDDAQAVIVNKEDGIKAIALKKPEADPKQIADDILLLFKISKNLRQSRLDNGAISFSRAKFSFDIDEKLNPTRFYIQEQKEANRLVEEFMLLANISVAKAIYKKFPKGALLRSHPAPNSEHMDQFLQYCKHNNIQMDTTSSVAFQKSLSELPKKCPHIPHISKIIDYMAARTMSTAVYLGSEEEVDFSHYALGVPFYTHFTSPIRRYPDIIVHRLLQCLLSGHKFHHKLSLGEISKNSNERKTNARKSSLECSNYFLGLYFKNHSPIYEGVISNIKKLKSSKAIVEVFCGELGLVATLEFKDRAHLTFEYTETTFTVRPKTPAEKEQAAKKKEQRDKERNARFGKKEQKHSEKEQKHPEKEQKHSEKEQKHPEKEQKHSEKEQKHSEKDPKGTQETKIVLVEKSDKQSEKEPKQIVPMKPKHWKMFDTIKVSLYADLNESKRWEIFGQYVDE
uniref:RNB domain-containing protein n=1 Tax=Arcella intermedia TaxID=1963864 RepID=A0A6B2KXE4_9EUKA